MEKASNSVPWFLMVACMVTVLAALASASRPCNSMESNSCPLNLDKLAAHELPQFLDISVKIRTGMVTWDNLDSNTKFLTGYKKQKSKQVISTKIVNVTNHMGTHVDAPSHTNETRLPVDNVDNMDLRTLNGPALVIQVPKGNNLTESVLKTLNIPRGVTRVLFRTDNSDRELWGKDEFFSDYTAFKPSGATWLVNNTDIKLVGIDYLSTATYDSVYDTHDALLSSQKKIVPLEGLDLRHITPGWYLLNCLPFNVAGMEGSPTRCIAAPINMEC